MAEETSNKKRLRKVETVRQRTEKAATQDNKPRRLRRTASVAARPLASAHRAGRREYYLPLPHNRLGTFLNKRRHWTPRYFRESWQELRLVVWPSRRETLKLATAVFIFAIIFALLIAVTDYGLDKLFKKVLLR